MNKLWVRMTLAFSTVILVAAGLVFFLVEFRRPQGPRAGAETGIAEQEAEAADIPFAPEERPRARRPGGPPPAAAGAAPESAEVARGGPPQRTGPGPLRRDLTRLAAIGSLLALAASIAIARGLSAPLSALAEAATAIGRGELARRVPERGTDETRQLARAFNAMADGLERGEEKRRALVADVAHELRTPLTVLQGNLQAMLDGVYPLEPGEIAKLHEQTTILSRLVADLHDLSQADAGQLRLERRPTDLRRLVRETVDAFTPLAMADNVRLEARVPADRQGEDDSGGISVEADPDRLRQVLHNLLGNALRHAPPGSAVAVELRAVSAGGADDGSPAGAPFDGVEITVSDAGSGIAVEDVSHVFDRFFRGDRSRTRSSGGAGLGLAIARALVRAHGGDVTVASPGEGLWSTTFTVHLPLS